MRALVLDGGIRLERDYPCPEPREGEALVRVSLAGVCDTDLQLMKGYMGFKGVLGHEFVGSVVSVHGGDERLAGKRVTGEINIPCGSCRFCREGLKNHCPGRSVLGILGKDGAFADFLTLPVENLYVVPGSVPGEAAVFTEPLAAAFEVLEQVDFKPSGRAAVLGDGKLGILIAQVLAASGVDVTAMGRHASKLAILDGTGVKTRLGAQMKNAAREFDVVVDATGSPSGLDDAAALVKPRGTIVLKTTVAARGAFDLNRIVIDEISLVGSRCGPFAKALAALEKGVIDPRPLIGAVVGMDEGEKALEIAAPGQALKILISMDDDR